MHWIFCLWHWQAVCPDAEIQSSPSFFKSCQNLAIADFTKNMLFFKKAPTVIVHLGYIWKKICSQDLSEIAQTNWGGRGPVFKLWPYIYTASNVHFVKASSEQDFQLY